jgi:hypothetical protein
MKKTLFLVLFCLIALVSCKKDDSVKSKLSSGNGKWNVTHLEQYVYSQNGYFCNDCGELNFNRNKTGEMVIGGTASTFTYSVKDDGKKLVLYIDESGTVYNITWNWNRSEFTLLTDLSINGLSQLITCKKN